MLPFESRMNVGKVLDLFGNQCLGKVHYIQSQNDNMHNEWSPLMRDIPESLSFAQFLGKPDACNIWIGDKHAKTSLHKDHYENIYIVVAGMKHFTM